MDGTVRVRKMERENMINDTWESMNRPTNDQITTLRLRRIRIDCWMVIGVWLCEDEEDDDWENWQVFYNLDN